MSEDLITAQEAARLLGVDEMARKRTLRVTFEHDRDPGGASSYLQAACNYLARDPHYPDRRLRVAIEADAPETGTEEIHQRRIASFLAQRVPKLLTRGEAPDPHA